MTMKEFELTESVKDEVFHSGRTKLLRVTLEFDYAPIGSITIYRLERDKKVKDSFWYKVIVHKERSNDTKQFTMLEESGIGAMTLLEKALRMYRLPNVEEHESFLPAGSEKIYGA